MRAKILVMACVAVFLFGCAAGPDVKSSSGFSCQIVDHGIALITEEGMTEVSGSSEIVMPCAVWVNFRLDGPEEGSVILYQKTLFMLDEKVVQTMDAPEAMQVADGKLFTPSLILRCKEPPCNDFNRVIFQVILDGKVIGQKEFSVDISPSSAP